MPNVSPTLAVIGDGSVGLTFSIDLNRCGIKHKIYEVTPAFVEIGALTLIDLRIRKCYDGFATCNESEDQRDT